VLEDLNYELNDTSIHPISHVRRALQGLISYHGCTNRELGQFVKNRKLRCASRMPPREDLIKLLEEEDTRATFKRFAELPPELREHIYKLHFATYPVLETPVEPPITKASRLVRQEALPVFYQICRFHIEFEPYTSDSQLGNVQIQPTAVTRGYFAQLSTIKRKYMENLQAQIIFPKLRSSTSLWGTWWLRLGKLSDGEQRATYIPDTSAGNEDVWTRGRYPELKINVEARLESLVDTMAVKQTGERLVRSELAEILNEAMEETYS
jgi:hypothetical protein